MLEVVVRGLVLYTALLIAARVMGKRMATQLSLLELSVILTLGAIVGLPLELPQRGLLPALVALSVVVLYQKGVAVLSFAHPHLESLTQGKLRLVVKDGILNLQTLRRSGYSRERLFAMFRTQGLEHFGKIKRLCTHAASHPLQRLQCSRLERSSPFLG